MRLFDYDDSDELSILEYAKQLENKTFREIYNLYLKEKSKGFNDDFLVEEESVDYSTNVSAKGQLGNFLEKYYFGYKPNGEQQPDFPKVGVELKQTCVDRKKNGQFTAGERLSITNISYDEPVEHDFYASHVWDKIKKILLVHYLRDKSKDRMDYQFLFVNLFTPPKEDLKIIVDDYNKINSKIEAGLAHELSESDTLYLGACTKGATAGRSLRPQYYGNHELAKKRNFCFKRQYMDYVLNTYVLKKKVPYETIIKNEDDIKNQTFEDYILSRINSYVGKTDKEICSLVDREYNNNKAQWNDLAFRMLGIKSNKAAEFMKANIVVKTIRIEDNGKNKESMSFPVFKINEFINEEWEESALLNYFDTTKFLFVVFRKDGSKYRLEGAKFWQMPYKDLHETVKEEWLWCQKVMRTGVKFKKKIKGGNITIENNIPKSSETNIIHVRPHASKSAYKLHDGYACGDIYKDGDQLPNGEWMTKQCFWLNNSYVLKILEF